MQFRLMLDRDQLDRARKIAREIAIHLRKYTDRHTSTAIERAGLRAMGVCGAYKSRPLTELIIENIGKERLRDGAGYWLGYVMWEKKCDAAAGAAALAQHGLPATLPRGLPHGEIRRRARDAAVPFLKQVEAARTARGPGGERRGWGPGAVVVVTTGDLARDIAAIHALLKEGATGVILRPPISPTTEQLAVKTGGWRSRTYDLLEACTKGAAAVAAGHRGHKPPTHFCWGGNHLLAPEVVAGALTEPLHAVEYDALTAARLDGIHFKRALVDQHFLYRCCAAAGLTVVVASDRWRSCCDGYQEGHDLCAGMIFAEAVGESAGLALEQIAQRHGLCIPPARPDRLALELAHAQLVRELFPQIPLGFAGDGAPGEEGAAAFAGALAGCCDYAWHLLDGVRKEKATLDAVRVALRQSLRFGALLGDVSDDVAFCPNGKVIRRTHTLLERALKTLEQLHHRDLLKTAAQPPRGLFALPDAGAGMDGVIQKGKFYWHPLEEWACRESASS